MARDYIRWVPSVRVMKLTGRIHTRLYRATRGLLGGRADGLDILLLSTRGRRSGQLRTTPLPYFRDGGELLLVASFGGNARNPDWLLNLRADPRVTIQVRGRRISLEACIAEAEQRERLWAAITAEHPRYADYQTRTARQIPIVVLPGAGAG